MVAIASTQVNAFLRSPDPKFWAILIYGQDAGLVSERAHKLAKTISGRENPPGEIVHIHDRDLEEDSGRLGVELFTLAMFGGRKVVRASASRRITAASLKEIVSQPTAAGYLIVEAGQLRADDAMRKLFADNPAAAAVASYQDSARDLEALIDEILKPVSLQISPDARQQLLARLGADRALSRGEIEKLALYASGKPRIEVEDVEAIVGDASDLAIDRVITAAVSGHGAQAVDLCDRTIASGDSAQAIILMLQRHLLRLHQVRAALDGGRSVTDAMRALRPPAFQKQADVLASQSRQWSSARLQAALHRCAIAAKSARLDSGLEVVYAERLLLAVSALAHAKG